MIMMEKRCCKIPAEYTHTQKKQCYCIIAMALSFQLCTKTNCTCLQQQHPIFCVSFEQQKHEREEDVFATSLPSNYACRPHTFSYKSWEREIVVFKRVEHRKPNVKVEKMGHKKGLFCHVKSRRGKMATIL